jgi:hypothetical protein
VAIQVTVDGEELDVSTAEIRIPVQDGTLVWKFGVRQALRALLDHNGTPVSHSLVDHDEIAEELWFA